MNFKLSPKKIANLLGRLRYYLRVPSNDRHAQNNRRQYANSRRGRRDIATANALGLSY